MLMFIYSIINLIFRFFLMISNSAFNYTIPNLDNVDLVLRNPPILSARYFSMDMMFRNTSNLTSSQIKFLNHIKEHPNVYGIVINIDNKGDIEAYISSFNAQSIRNQSLLWLPFLVFGFLLVVLLGSKDVTPAIQLIVRSISLVLTCVGIIGIPSQLVVPELNKKRFWIWYPLAIISCFLLIVFFVIFQ